MNDSMRTKQHAMKNKLETHIQIEQARCQNVFLVCKLVGFL